VSWASGIGRIGSVLGSMLGGAMLSLQWDLSTVFLIVAIPAFVAGSSMLAMGWTRSRQGVEMRGGFHTKAEIQ
jgi:AAHS family 4-hydroxybenzoate transporter-like MFS transporter